MLEKQMCKERRKDREGQGKGRVLESFFFLIIFFTKY